MKKKKVVSFSIFGNQEKYLVGIYENIELVRLFYPGWYVYIYFDNTVPLEFINTYNEESDIKFIDMSGRNMPGMFWRFLPYDDLEVELYIVRDLDSRITMREAVAVFEWIKSKKKLHIMRDHPYHVSKILGGMWGLKRSHSFSMLNSIINFVDYKSPQADLYVRQLDQDFLEVVIYPKFINSKIVHASFNKFEFFTKNFVVDRKDNSFIGEVVTENSKQFGDRELIAKLEANSSIDIKLWFKNKFN